MLKLVSIGLAQPVSAATVERCWSVKNGLVQPKERSALEETSIAASMMIAVNAPPLLQHLPDGRIQVSAAAYKICKRTQQLYLLDKDRRNLEAIKNMSKHRIQRPKLG
jgi:hypothetical protein